MKCDRILVTGGAGFIGSTTVDRLLMQGKQVVVLDNLYSGRTTHLQIGHPLLEFVEGDILEFPLLKELIDGVHAVLHLAAIASVPLSIDEPIYTTQVNMQGFLHVLQAIKACGGNKRLVYASSAAVYGDAVQLPCRDTVALQAPSTSPYALQKRQCEEFADLYARLFGITSLGLRYFNVYGPRQDPASPYSGVISKFLAAYLQQQPLIIRGDGKQSRDFIHVSDVAEANYLALTTNYDGILNIATGQPQTLLTLINCLEYAGGEKPMIEFVEQQMGDIKHSYADTSLAQQTINFCATKSLQQGIDDLLRSVTDAIQEKERKSSKE